MTIPSVPILQVLIAFQSFFFSLFLLSWRRTRSNLALGILLFLLGGHLGAEFLQETGLLEEGTTLAHLSGLLYGPLFLVFVHTLAFKHHNLRPAQLLHLAPFSLAAAAFSAGALPDDLLAISIFASLGGYLLAAFVAVRRYRSILEGTRSDIPLVPLAWLRYAVLGLFVVYLLDMTSFLATKFSGRSGTSVPAALLFAVLLVYVYGFVFAALQHPRLFAGVTVADREVTAAPARHELNSQDLEDLARLERLMHEKRPYMEPELTLAQLAQTVGFPLRRLSALVNRGKGQNFANWVNRYRVEEAKCLLVDPRRREQPILDILFAAGFNSKSTFNAIFKDQTGVTPTQFQRLNRR